MEPTKSQVSDSQRPRAHCQELGRERHSDHGKAELCSLRHDHSPSHRLFSQTETNQEGAGISAVSVDQ